jgi:hypothetical protein
MRECRSFVENHSETWQKRTEQEERRIEKEEKKTSLEMVEKKKNKYSKAVSRRLDNEEEGKIRNERLRKTDLSETMEH